MRHGNKGNHLGRTMEHRRALLANLAISLIEHKRIETTVAKAKALRVYIEPLITRAKENTTHSRRVVFGYLQNKEAIKELFGDIAEKVGTRPGGYVRIIRIGFRKGDAADMAMIELVDYNPAYVGNAKTEATKAKRKRTRRGGGGGAAKTAAPATAEAAATPSAEDAAESQAGTEE